MGTKYHIGDMFRVPRKRALAVIVEVNKTNPLEKYSVRYVDCLTHDEIPSGGDMPKSAWWTAEELQQNFKKVRIFEEG